MLPLLCRTVSVLTVLYCNTNAGVNSFSALTSIFHSTHLLEEIIRLTFKTKRTEVLSDLREGRRKESVGMCLVLKSKKKKSIT